MLTRFTSFLFRAAAASLLSFSLPVSAAGNVIVIGHAIDLSGPNASLGRDYVAGIKTCFDMVNAAGGIHGKRILYLACDDLGQPEMAASVSTELIERDQADYLFGGIGDDATLAVLNTPAFKRSSHILFAPLAADDYANSARVLFWRPDYKQEIGHIFSHFSKIGITNIDLGGLSVVSSNGSNRLSSYLDIALFREGSGLMF